MKTPCRRYFLLALILYSITGHAEDNSSECRLIDDDQQRLRCYDDAEQAATQPLTGTPLDSRLKQELASLENSFVLTAHQPSYILPLAYADSPNEAPYASTSSGVPGGQLDRLEVKFQISFRVPVNRDFFFRNSHLWFGYTHMSLWQLYNDDASAPFRETNYEPELIWSFLVNKDYGKLRLTHVAASLNHQSNGRSEPLSRSWNRIYINTIWAYEDWIFSFRPWYRLPENDSEDDNPDIEDYLGHFDFRVAKKYQDHTTSLMFRSNLDRDEPHNFYELNYSFSINRKVRGYVQFVSGYGESLIDYNHRNQRFGIGVMLNDWF